MLDVLVLDLLVAVEREVVAVGGGDVRLGHAEALGGAGALAAKCIKSCEVIAFPELGCESIKKLEITDFPLIVAIDSCGNSLFNN